MDDKNFLIIGANGQLGLALQSQYPHAKISDADTLDITNKKSVDSFDWSGINVVINAAAYTNVDGAETKDGRVAAWQVNAKALANLANICRKNNITLVHISSDYVFDGTKHPHTESEPLSPLSVYGQSKAAGDLIVSTLDKYYILRTTWVIGQGKNFVRTMLNLASKGISPTVVNDQIGRLTFTGELVRAIDHLLKTSSEYGVYNVTNSGPVESWADITRRIFALSNHNELSVANTTTAEYFTEKEDVAPRPLFSEMSLEKLHATGFESRSWISELEEYISKEQN